MYMSDIVLGPHTARLGKVFKELLTKSQIHPFIGPIKDNSGVVRIGKGDVPTLMDIQRMRWLSDIVSED